MRSEIAHASFKRFIQVSLSVSLQRLDPRHQMQMRHSKCRTSQAILVACHQQCEAE